jgi:hypothetical protein
VRLVGRDAGCTGVTLNWLHDGNENRRDDAGVDDGDSSFVRRARRSGCCSSRSGRVV